jgi:hypothetical protein
MDKFRTPTMPRKPIEFHFFKYLAPEIRTKIWEYALPGPRIVDVTYDQNNDCFLEWSEPATIHLVHANWEARNIVFENYTALFGTAIQPPLVYANLRIDVIRLNFNAFRQWKLIDHEYDNIRFLEINDREIYKVPARELAIHLGIMPQLEQFVVVDPQGLFVGRPFPTVPAQPTPEAVYDYYVARGEYHLGRAWGLRYQKIWKDLLQIDFWARLGKFGLTNFATGMVTVNENGIRQYRMIGRADHTRLH